jgi:hypothetical protein
VPVARDDLKLASGVLARHTEHRQAHIVALLPVELTFLIDCRAEEVSCVGNSCVPERKKTWPFGEASSSVWVADRWRVTRIISSISASHCTAASSWGSVAGEMT